MKREPFETTCAPTFQPTSLRSTPAGGLWHGGIYTSKRGGQAESCRPGNREDADASSTPSASSANSAVSRPRLPARLNGSAVSPASATIWQPGRHWPAAAADHDLRPVGQQAAQAADQRDAATASRLRTMFSRVRASEMPWIAAQWSGQNWFRSPARKGSTVAGRRAHRLPTPPDLPGVASSRLAPGVDVTAPSVSAPRAVSAAHDLINSNRPGQVRDMLVGLPQSRWRCPLSAARPGDAQPLPMLAPKPSPINGNQGMAARQANDLQTHRSGPVAARQSWSTAAGGPDVKPSASTTRRPNPGAADRASRSMKQPSAGAARCEEHRLHVPPATLQRATPEFSERARRSQ